jgi:glycerol-3-phosphate acyltransferase PlsY
MSNASSKKRLLAAGVLGYLAGTFPTADVVTRAVAERRGEKEIDLRRRGMKNPGAWNAAMLLGLRPGLVVLAGDIVKGIAASLLGRAVAGDNGAYAAGAAAVTGHCFPVWKGFRGGKGLAASAGTALANFPPYAPIDVSLAAAALVALRGRGALATYIASAAFTLAATYWWLRDKGNLWGPKPTVGLPLYAMATSLVIVASFLRAPLAKSPFAFAEVAAEGDEEPVEEVAREGVLVS